MVLSRVRSCSNGKELALMSVRCECGSSIIRARRRRPQWCRPWRAPLQQETTTCFDVGSLRVSQMKHRCATRSPATAKATSEVVSLASIRWIGVNGRQCATPPSAMVSSGVRPPAAGAAAHESNVSCLDESHVVSNIISVCRSRPRLCCRGWTPRQHGSSSGWAELCGMRNVFRAITSTRHRRPQWCHLPGGALRCDSSLGNSLSLHFGPGLLLAQSPLGTE